MRTAEQALAAAYAHGPGKPALHPPRTPAVRPRPVRPRPPGPAVPLADLARATPLGPALARTLTAALAPRRWEPANAYNDHRAYPSLGALFLTDVVIHLGRQRWLIDPVRLAAHPAGQVAPRHGSAAAGPVTVALHAYPDRLPEGYGTLGEPAVLLEAGHVSGALVEAARAEGLRPVARAVPADDWPATGLGGRGSNPGSKPGSGRGGQPLVLIGLAADGTASWPRRRVLAPRSSGTGLHGRLSADPRPLPTQTWQAFLAALRAVPAGSLATRGDADRLRHRLAVGRVTGAAEGRYEWRGGRLSRYGEPVLEELREAFGSGPEISDVAGLSLAWVMTASLAHIIRADGASAYPRTLLAAGAVAQHVCSAAAMNGMFCRPVRDIDEPAVEAVMGVPAAEDAVYTLLIGRPLVQDFSYDLTDPRRQP